METDEKIYMTPAQRVNLVAMKTGLNIKALSEALGYSRPQGLYDVASGRTKNISSDLANKIVTAFPEFSRTWLITGEGSMLAKNSPAIKDSLKAAPQHDGVLIPHELVQMFGDMAATIRSQQEELASLREHHAGYMSATKKSENVLTDVDR